MTFLEKLKAKLTELGVTDKMKLFFEENKPDPVKMGVAKLADGSDLNYEGDSLSVGSAVKDVADGEYTLEDGSTCVVASGVVTELKPKAVEPPPAPMTTPEMMAQLSEIKTQMSAQTKRIEALEKENKSLKENNVTAFTALKAISEMEVVAPITKQKSIDEMTNADIMRANRGK